MIFLSRTVLFTAREDDVRVQLIRERRARGSPSVEAENPKSGKRKEDGRVPGRQHRRRDLDEAKQQEEDNTVCLGVDVHQESDTLVPEDLQRTPRRRSLSVPTSKCKRQRLQQHSVALLAYARRLRGGFGVLRYTTSGFSSLSLRRTSSDARLW